MRQLDTVITFDLLDESLESKADKLGADFGNGHDDAILRQNVAVDLHRQGLTVDQNTVAIENDVFGHEGRLAGEVLAVLEIATDLLRSRMLVEIAVSQVHDDEEGEDGDGGIEPE